MHSDSFARFRSKAFALSRVAAAAWMLLCCAPGCGGDSPAGGAGGNGGLALSLTDTAQGEGNPCLALADGVTIDIVPGGQFGPFWRDPAGGALALPALPVLIGQTGSAQVDIHVLGYISEAPPPRGLPISRGDLYGLELRASTPASTAVIQMICADNDGDGIQDIEEDCNLNGRLDRDAPACAQGALYETDPARSDTDGGGTPDGDERDHLTDPLDPGDDLVLFGMFPRVVYPGDEVVISGRGFSRALYDNVVRFDGRAAQNLSIDPYQRYLRVRVPDEVVPAGKLQEPLTVEVSGLESRPIYYVPGGAVLATIPVGAYPDNVLLSPDGGRAYVANHDSRDLSVVGLESLAELTGPGSAGRIPLGEDPLSMDIAPDGGSLYVVNRLSETVTPVDCHGLSAAAADIPVGPEPWDVVMLPNRPRAYVVNYGAHVQGVVSVLDTALHRHVADIDFPFDLVTSAHGVEIGLTPDGTRAWLVHDPEHHIYKIDTATDEVRWGETVLGTCTEGRKLTFAPDGKFAYLVGPGQAAGLYTMLNEVPVLDRFVYQDDSDCFPVRVSSTAMDMVMTPDGGRLYIGSHAVLCSGRENCNVGEVFAVDLAARDGTAVLTSYSVTDLAVSPDGRRVYAADMVADRIHVLSTVSDTAVAEVTVPGDMDRYLPADPSRGRWREHHRRRIALSPDGARLLTANSLSNDVSVFAVGDPAPFEFARIPQTAALETPGGDCCDRTLVAFGPDGSLAYATADGTHNLSVIDTRTNRVVRTVDFQGFVGARGEGECPRISRIAVSPDGASVYCWLTRFPACLRPWEDLLARVDVDTGIITSALWTGCSASPYPSLHPHPDGRKVYFLNSCVAATWILDPVDLHRLGTIPVAASDLVFDPVDPGRAYLIQPHGIVMFDPRNDVLLDADGDPGTTGQDLPDGISRIETGADNLIFRPVFSPGENRLYAVDGWESGAGVISDEILVVDLAANRLAHAFRPRGRPVAAVPCPEGRRLYVVVGGSPEVQIYDTRSFELTGRIPVGNETQGLAVTPDQRYLLATTRTAIYAVDIASDQVVSSIPVCGYKETVETVAFSPDGSLAYVGYNPRPTSAADRTAAGVAVIRIVPGFGLQAPGR